MRKFFYSVSLVLFSVIALASSLFSDVKVKGYYRKDGTYVQPHYRSDPDGNVWNNWSTYPNINPYTGKQGTKYKYSYPKNRRLKGRAQNSTMYRVRSPEEKNAIRLYEEWERKQWLKRLGIFAGVVTGGTILVLVLNAYVI